MKTLSTLQFQDQLTQAAALPSWCKYKLLSAEKILHFVHKDCEIVSQQVRYNYPNPSRFFSNPFIIDLLEIQQNRHSAIPFSISSSQMFMCFMLEGSFTINRTDDQLTIPHNTFQFCILGADNYRLELLPGRHVALLFTIDPEWLKRAFTITKKKEFKNIFKEYKSHERPFMLSNPCPLSPVIAEWLSTIYLYIPTTMIITGVGIFLSPILDHYHQVMIRGKYSLAEEIKLYLDENFHSKNLNVEMLAKAFNETRQKLRRNFKNKYDVNIHEYYTSLRIKFALEHIDSGELLCDFYDTVGYRSTAALRSALKRSGYRVKSDRSD